MKKRHLLFMIGFIGLLMNACNDNDPIVIPEEENQEVLDDFKGEAKIIDLPLGMKGFHEPTFICRIKTDNGKIISRKGKHQRIGGRSTLQLANGLSDGDYQVLELIYPKLDEVTRDTLWHEFGLGCRIHVANKNVQIMDTYNSNLNLFGQGTEDDPYTISSGSHLIDLLKLHLSSASQNEYEEISNNKHFQQICDINMSFTSKICDEEYFWLGIGELKRPFTGVYDGGGYKIKNLTTDNGNEGNIKRHAVGMALFNYTLGASIINVNLVNANIQGSYAVGGIVGVVLTEGDRRRQTTLVNCSIEDSSIRGVKGSVGVGGMVGGTDEYSAVIINNCFMKQTTVASAYNAGGLFGIAGRYSLVAIEACETDAKTSIESQYSCAGGLVGASDSLVICSSINRALVKGASQFKGDTEKEGYVGAGGLVGGTGCAHIIASINKGKVQGYEGVGGLVGSSRFGNANNYYFQDVNVVSSKNLAQITGYSHVGGICGESQFSAYRVINEGEILATGKGSTVGGIIGNSSSCSVHNSINRGAISTSNQAEMVGGIVGCSVWANLFACQNFGPIDVKADYVGGIAGAGGNYSVINHCANFQTIKNKIESAKVGGIVGSIGDPKNWSEANKRACIITCIKTAVSLVRPFVNTGLADIYEESASIVQLLIDLRKVTVSLYIPIINSVKGLQSLVLSGTALANRNDVTHFIDTNKQKAEEIGSTINNEISSIRSTYVLTKGFLNNELNSDLIKNYMLNENALVATSEKDNGETINFIMNKMREDRFDEVERWEKIESITHFTVSGVCWATGTIMSIIGAIGSFGTATPAAASIIVGMTLTVVNAANSLTASTMDFNSNAVIVSQCVNMGHFDVVKSSSTGGITGVLENYGLVKDCLNTGGLLCNDYATRSGQSGIIGDHKLRSRMYRCINLNKKWYATKPMSSGQDITTASKDNYQYPEVTGNLSWGVTELNLEEVGQIKSYDSDNINIRTDQTGLWQLVEGKGNYPIPWQSEMSDIKYLEN